MLFVCIFLTFCLTGIASFDTYNFEEWVFDISAIRCCKILLQDNDSTYAELKMKLHLFFFVVTNPHVDVLYISL